MLEVQQSTRINTDASEDDLKPGEYRDALNISMMANELGAFSKGTTFGNIDTNIKFLGLNADAVCLGTAIDTAGTRVIITFYQRVPIPFNAEYQGVLDYATSRGFQVPSPQVQVAQNYLITLLKLDSIWNGLDVFYCFFGDGDNNFAKINWKTPNDATLITNNGAAPMSYAPNSGFKGTGSGYLDTQWVPSTAVKFQLNDSCFVIGYEEIVENASGLDGVITNAGANRAYIYPQDIANRAIIAINSSNERLNTDPTLGPEPGVYFVSTNAAPSIFLRKNTGAPFAPAGILRTARPTASFYIGGGNINGAPAAFTTNRYSFFTAGEYLNTFDRETKFYKNWLIYKNSFVTTLVTETHVQEVLMYLIPDQVEGVLSPLVKSSLMQVDETSYLDGYSFVNELFFFNFRQSAPKVINIQRALDSPGFYDKLSETTLTVIKPHPPYSPTAVRAVTVPPGPVNPAIQKKPFQFMIIYRFVDGEQSTKSPASEYLNSLDDRDALLSNLGQINVTMTFPQKDYSIVKEVELYVRNNNNIADWRSVNVFKRELFVQAGENYTTTQAFTDNAIGNFLPIELSTKLNDSVPQRSNYLAFIESRLFLIDSLIDYDFTSTFQILITNTTETNAITPDDRLPAGGTPQYGLAEFEYDSEYSVGLAFYDKYGRKYPSSINDKKLVTARFVPSALPALDALPKQDVFPALLNRKKITAIYDLRAAGNPANYGKPPSFAYWWGLIRSKNTKWEFQQSIQCLLRFPYSITKWTDPDPDKFPDPNLFLEDGYLYWHPEKLLYGPETVDAGLNLTRTLINDYIDVVVPPNFPYPLDNTIFIDFMMEVCTDVNATRITITDREVVETFANKIRIRGDRRARWFSNDPAGIGQFKGFPKFTTGVNLTGVDPNGIALTKDETTFPLIIKRRRQNNLENILLYDTPQIYPVNNPGTRFCSFQPTQSANILRAEYPTGPPVWIAPVLARTLNQGDILIQPIFITPTTVAFNHSIKITWGPNAGDDLRLKIKVSLWQLNDLNQPILELYSATGDAGGPYSVKNNETVEYLINAQAELTDGWYGYGITILEATASNAQFDNPSFDFQLDGWLQSFEGLPPLAWKWASTNGNFAYVDISAMGAGFSRTLYQYLNNATKDDLTIEIVVEGVNIVGPVANTPVAQYPGNANVPLTNNSTESLLDLGRNIVPYYIDCITLQRIVTMNSMSYTLTSGAPAGTLVRAEIWTIDQTSKRPIAVIAGSESAWTPIGAPGVHTLNFGANKVINATGWYGIALAFDSPLFSQFANNNYANGGSGWNITAGSPSWAFQPDTNNPPVYADSIITPALGADQGYQRMDASGQVLTPIFFPASTDPSGYDNHRIIIDWGNNVPNGWHGASINVVIFDVDQATKKPTSFVPLMSASIDIRSNGQNEYFLSNAQKLLGNKWYAFGLSSPTGHPDTLARSFANYTFNPSLGLNGWSTTPGSNNGSWSPEPDSAQATGFSAGAMDSGILYQAIAGYVQVSLIQCYRASATMTQAFAHLTLNGVVQQTIDITAKIASIAAFDIVFDAVKANGGNVGIKITGTCTGPWGIFVSGVYNSFNPFKFSTPKIRKYGIGNANNESWVNFGPGVVDEDRTEGDTYWKQTATDSSPGTESIFAAERLSEQVYDSDMQFVDGWTSAGGGSAWSFLNPFWENLLADGQTTTAILLSSSAVKIPKGGKLTVKIGMFGVSGVPATFQMKITGLPTVNIPIDPAGGTIYNVEVTADVDFYDVLRIQLVTTGSGYGFNPELHGAFVNNLVGEIYAVLPFNSAAFPDSRSSLVYTRINMGDVPPAVQTWRYSLVLKLDTFGANNFFEVWVFNDPATFNTTGVRIFNLATAAFMVSHPDSPINIPGGYKFIGYRNRSSDDVNQELLKLKWTPPAGGYNSWYKEGYTMWLQAKERQLISSGDVAIANFHADNVAFGATTVRIGQDNLSGVQVRANVELFAGLGANTYTLILYDSAGVVLGSTTVVNQALNANPQITVIAVNAPSTTGLYLAVRNDNVSGTISIRLRNITNVNAAVTIASDSTAPFKTWQVDNFSNAVQLASASFGQVTATQDVPQPPGDITIVLADAAGTEISAPQLVSVIPGAGKQTLQFAATLAQTGNFNYGVKVKNHPTNGQISGTIRIHSIENVATNDGVANVIAHTIDPGQPLYEAWNQFSLGAFVRAGYVSNFIAVVSDLVMSAFTPIAVNPTSYHVVANIVPAGVVNHSNNYGPPPVGDSTYNYGIVYPSISSDPDAAGIVYIQKTGQSIGDINIRIIDLGEKSQSNIVRWSDPIIAGTRTNNTNAFTDGNKYAVDFQRGAIQVMIAMHDHTLFCVHTQGMSSLYVGRSYVSSPSEVITQNDELFLTNKVIGNDNKLTSNLGTVNPESVMVVESGTIAYGFDLIRKSFWQKTNNGVRNLTYECSAKQFFNRVCENRLQAHNDGEDVKVFVGYNEKQKSFYLTFAPFILRGQIYPAVTIAYNAYIDGFLSRYSFEPIAYLATEDVIHTVKAREFQNPDFFGDFTFWLTDSSTSDYAWILKYGQWNDNGFWDDAEKWIDL